MTTMKKRGALPLQLSKDIKKTLHHMFRDHQNCSDFCKASMQKDKTTPNDKDTDTEHVTEFPVSPLPHNGAF